AVGPAHTGLPCGEVQAPRARARQARRGGCVLPLLRLETVLTQRADRVVDAAHIISTAHDTPPRITRSLRWLGRRYPSSTRDRDVYASSCEPATSHAAFE